MNDTMLGKDEVLRLLEEIGIPFSCERHDPVRNMSESDMLTLSVAGARCKNLLLQDRKGHYFLVVTTAAKSLDLAELAAALGSKRLSFASADKLFELLGIRPGSLSPLALVNDETGRVRLIIDVELRGEERFLFHPLENDASVSLSGTGLDTFLRHIDHPADWLPVCARQAFAAAGPPAIRLA
ncbi:MULTISPECIES: prolyl-tRNA synthetase associated domain-containing protein [unclassified Burkholderia]|uniref:prolyl-tRNA synthetase associated domain-containing protein n=1 Tax=unclassified Burkholderia TaxID=2613784 RepID=UPI000F57DFAB|nr:MULTISPECIES: prolyl-tRNA synthetase associated domain-containing protein [unclassified Burkholderia]RQR81696.1 prolyl-tRNA synthetase associated domain-containing protein [Burkholderia sp. Bp9011]RQR91395.1 prolyl-tRNA synthetase associated domain-containing protein [Burkholderia sp. Bp9010]RQS56389.1 prolyl-tRNA synthetase associated domain-containing protein [Burkholderia sp. Bp8986]RQS60014.1 prolyl-tRNA synthetase associated domain-containing protein [Burkholderia sp. Bp8984]RQS75812.1